MKMTCGGLLGLAAVAAILTLSPGCGSGDDEEDGPSDCPSCLTNPTSYSSGPYAANYGVADPAMSALVVRDRSGVFKIQTGILRSTTTDYSADISVANDGEKTYTIAPGSYRLYVTYYAKRRSGLMIYTCTKELTASFSVSAGRAKIYELTGEDDCSMMYMPPKLESVSQ